jgi:iron complex outermembrane receptor protein
MKPLRKHCAVLRYSILCGSLLAAAGWSSLASATEAAAATDTAADTGLAEIVVTAERYTSTIQNTPISITALTGDQLNAAGITSLEDVIREVPGLSMRSSGPGLTELEARGLASNGGAAPTVGFYLDEIPLSPPAVSQSGKIVIDPDLYDLNRIEVLRGPQGTLYGSGSMGGTVKLVTNQPKLNTYEGSFQGTLSDTEGGSGNGGGSFMLNVPVGDTLALRLVGTDNYRSGWLDRIVVQPFPQDLPVTPGTPLPVQRVPNVLDAPVTNVVTNVNTVSLYGGRATLLFQPSDAISNTASFFYQRLATGGLDLFDSPPGGSYQAHYQAFDIREPSADTIHIYSNNAVLNLNFADLTSATAYWERRQYQLQDASESASYANGVFPYVAIPYSETNNSQQFSQELRLSSRG